MHIYGAYQRQKPQQLEDEANGFFLKGFANDVNEVMQKARVCIAPLRFGAGLKGKLVDAMQNGLPCVTTSVGEEGLFGKLNPNGFIADDPQHFSDKAIALYNDKSIWKSKQKNGFLVINERFEKSVRQQDLLNRVEVLQEDLEKHRLHNFTGAMLEHHMLQSTKFMSKWIEEKNKLN